MCKGLKLGDSNDIANITAIPNLCQLLKQLAGMYLGEAGWKGCAPWACHASEAWLSFWCTVLLTHWVALLCLLVKGRALALNGLNSGVSIILAQGKLCSPNGLGWNLKDLTTWNKLQNFEWSLKACPRGGAVVAWDRKTGVLLLHLLLGLLNTGTSYKVSLKALIPQYKALISQHCKFHIPDSTYYISFIFKCCLT